MPSDDLGKRLLIPDTSSSMVRYALNSLRTHFFFFIVQEEVDQNGVELGFGMLATNLPTKQFDAPNAAASELDLPRMAALYGFKLVNMVPKRWAIRYAAKRMKDLGYSIV